MAFQFFNRVTIIHTKVFTDLMHPFYNIRPGLPLIELVLNTAALESIGCSVSYPKSNEFAIPFSQFRSWPVPATSFIISYSLADGLMCFLTR